MSRELKKEGSFIIAKAAAENGEKTASLACTLASITPAQSIGSKGRPAIEGAVS